MPSKPTNPPYCPLPGLWDNIYMGQLKLWRELNDPDIPEPQKPMILGGWHLAHIYKVLAWWNTKKWAQKYGNTKMIDSLKPEDYFYG